jgi:putative MATE family efflux protein
MSTSTPAVSLAFQPKPFTAESLDRRIWQLAVPAIGENLLQTLLLITDTLMIARFGSVSIAASAVAGTILWRVHMTLGCIERGTTAMVARYYGEGDMERLGRTVAQAICLAIGFGSIIGISGFILAHKFCYWMGADKQVVAAGTPFLQAIFVASVARMFFFVAAAAVRGSGDTRSPMWITLWMNVLNIGFNYILIFGHFGAPALGLVGSGVSTAIALYFSAVAILWIILSGRTCFYLRRRHFHADWSLIRTILRISAPSFLEEIVISSGYLLFFAFIARMGTTVLAAHQVSTRIEATSFMAGFGFSIAASTLVGQSLGMGRIDLAKKSFRRATGYCVLLMSAIAFLLILFSDKVVAAFQPAEDVRDLAKVLLIIAALEQPLLGIGMTLAGGIRGAGDTISPMATSIVGNVLIRVFVVYYLAFTLGLGIYGVYIGTVIDWVVRASMMYYFYRRGRWARLRI